MKVILTQTVPNVGKQGTLVTVKNGYARNFLFPRQLAIVADKNQLKSLERREARMAGKLAETKAGAAKLAEQLDGKIVRIEGHVGKEMGKLFGAVTSQHIADAAKAQLNFDLEKRQVALVEPIKRLGRHNVHLDLHRDVDATLVVIVFDPADPTAFDKVETPVEEETPEAAAEATPEASE